MLFSRIIAHHQLNNRALIIHRCNMQCMITFIRCLVNTQLRYPFFLTLMKHLLQYLHVSFFCNMMKYRPSITILLIYISTAFQQDLNRFNVLLLIESLYRLQQGKCTENRFLFVNLLPTRDQKVYNLNISVL